MNKISKKARTKSPPSLEHGERNIQLLGGSVQNRNSTPIARNVARNTTQISTHRPSIYSPTFSPGIENTTQRRPLSESEIPTFIASIFLYFSAICWIWRILMKRRRRIAPPVILPPNNPNHDEGYNTDLESSQESIDSGNESGIG